MGTALLLLVHSAAAVEIEFVEIGAQPLTAGQMAAFNKAALAWESRLKDPFTVKVNIGFGVLDADVLGATTNQFVTHNYTTVRAALLANADDAVEEKVVSSLPANSVPVVDIGGSRSAPKATLTRANAKALGIGTTVDPMWNKPLANGADGTIIFSTAFANVFDYDPSDGISVGKIDFVAVATHEIGHLLGFVSVTDVQDINPAFNLGPMPLDFWRFARTGAAHLVGSEQRLITAGPAEYFDSIHNNIEFSWGAKIIDPNCDCCGGGCQASHWRDSHKNQLMDPTLANGTPTFLHVDDLAAIDHLGYDYTPRSRVQIKIPVAYDPQWKWKCPECRPFELPQGYPLPPEVREIPFTPNIGATITMDLTVPGQGVTRRTLTGFGIWTNSRSNHAPVLRGLSAEPGQMHLFPGGERAAMLPPALLDFYLVSDSSNGIPFTARATFADGGAAFEPALGEHGGFRLTFMVDSAGDGVSGDVDGLMTMELLANESGLPDPGAQNVYGVNPSSMDNQFEIIDALAFGLCQVGKTESEPNSSSATADDLGSPGCLVLTGSISTTNDVDWFRFTAPTNSRAWVTIDTGGKQFAGATSRDSVLTILRADAITVLEEDDNDGSGNGADGILEPLGSNASAVAGRLLNGGTFYLRVRAAQPGQIISPYRLYLTVTPANAPTEIESNNSAGEANSLVTSGQHVATRSGLLGTTNDVDYFAISVTKRSLLHLSVDGDPERDGTGTDTRLELIGPDGVSLLFGADSSTSGLGADRPAEGFPYVAPSAGIYYARVRSATAGVTGTYRIMVAACPLSPPSVSVAASAGVLLLSWPASPMNYTLQSSTDLRRWAEVMAPATSAGDRVEVSVSPDGPVRFFRLIEADGEIRGDGR